MNTFKNAPLNAVSLSGRVLLLSSNVVLLSYANAASPQDITNKVFSQQSPNCADYAASYTSSVTDINNKVSFDGAVQIKVQNGRCYFESNAIPNHDFNDGARAFPNDVSEQNLNTSVTAKPVIAGTITPLTIAYDNAIFLNGVKLDLLAAACYNEGRGRLGQEKAGCGDTRDGQTHPWRYDPLSPYNTFRTDSHDAHAQENGSYHYHSGPKALYDSDCGSTGVASPVIGFAADGFPIYGTCFNDNGTVRKVTSSYQLKTGNRQAVEGFTTPDPAHVASAQYDGQFRGDYVYREGAGDLDACNGMTIDGHYGYFVTDSFPWVLGCFSGTPDNSFAKRQR